MNIQPGTILHGIVRRYHETFVLSTLEHAQLLQGIPVKRTIPAWDNSIGSYQMTIKEKDGELVYDSLHIKEDGTSRSLSIDRPIDFATLKDEMDNNFLVRTS